jgi:hypothetical protein
MNTIVRRPRTGRAAGNSIQAVKTLLRFLAH